MLYYSPALGCPCTAFQCTGREICLLFVHKGEFFVFYIPFATRAAGYSVAMGTYTMVFFLALGQNADTARHLQPSEQKKQTHEALLNQTDEKLYFLPDIYFADLQHSITV